MALDDPGLAPPAPETKPWGAGRRSFGDFDLNETEHDNLANFLNEELTRAEQETSAFLEELTLWREFVDPKPRPKNFPWPNASNIFVPIPRMVLDTTKSAAKQAITRQVRLFTCELDDRTALTLGLPEGSTARVREALVRLAELLSNEAYLDLKRTLDEWLEEILVAGYGPLKLVVDRDVQRVWTRGGKEQTITRKSGPRFLSVPAGTFVYPAGLWRSVHEMPWCGNWVYLTTAEVRRRAQAPWSYQFVEEIVLAGGTTEKPSSYQQREEAMGQQVQMPGHKTYEISLIWDVYGDGKPADILVTYNKHANKIMRVVYGQIGDGLKPFEVEVASPRSGAWLGRGIIEPIVQPCRAINTSVNQTFDAQTLANAPSVLYPEDSAARDVLANGFFPGLPIPYKEDPKEIQVLQFPSPTATSFQMVQFFLGVVERLTRTGPGQTGSVETTQRAPASLGLAVAQAGRELTDELIDRVRDTVGRLYGRAIDIYAEDMPEVITSLLGEEDGSLVLMAIRGAKAAGKSVAGVTNLRLTASSGTRSVDIERQNAMATFQLTMGWEKEIIGLVQLYFQATQAGIAVGQDILLDILKASQLQIRRLVELSNQPDVQNIIPDIAARLESLRIQAPPAPTGAPSATPPTGGAPPSAAAAQMAQMGLTPEMMGGAGAPA